MKMIFFIMIGLLAALTIVILYSALDAASNADDIEEQEQERKRKAERFWEDNEGDEQRK